jgi:subtilisin-like proprotein convertase family protein
MLANEGVPAQSLQVNRIATANQMRMSARTAFPFGCSRRWVGGLLIFMLLMGSGRFIKAECATNETALIDLSSWTVVQYGPFGQGPAMWGLSDSNTVAIQTNNADSSILLSSFDLQSDKIQGSWRVETDFDDDFMGFVFGFQDERHFYLFDWKQAEQTVPNGSVLAKRGMTVKAFAADSTLTTSDFYATDSVNTNRVRTLYHNGTPWDDFADYQFELEFVPGHFTITIREGTNVLDTISIDDSTYFTGKFGFYNYSQDHVRYEGFTRRKLSPHPLISVSGNSVLEGNSGGTNLYFSVNLSLTNCEPTVVDYVITPGTATFREDYEVVRSGTLVFAPGETNKLVPVQVFGDLLREDDETIVMTLSNAVGGTISVARAVGVIINDDYPNQPPTVQIITPLEGAEFTMPPGIIPIRADAIDSDGFVQQVDFYAGGSWIGSSSSVPFGAQWTNQAPGAYVLTAIATDDRGLRGTSAPVHISIRACDPNLAAGLLTNVNRCSCDEARFGTEISSLEPFACVWKFNGNALAGQTNATLLLQNLKLEQAGVYTLEVSTPCATISRSANLTLQGAGNQNPVSFSNASRITITDNSAASPYPSSINVTCVPGVIQHLSVTLNGVSHNFPDDIDALLVGPSGQVLKLISDAGGNNKLTNVVISFSDTATQPLPDTARIFPGVFQPTDYAPADGFPAPAPAAATATNFGPFLGISPNGTWSLFVKDDLGGDAGSITQGWSLTIEWQDVAPRLSAPAMLEDGQFQMILQGLPRMAHLIEVSTNLVTWSPLMTVTPGAQSALVIDPAQGGSTCRFYRAARCP